MSVISRLIAREGVIIGLWALASVAVAVGGIALTWQGANHLLRQDLRAAALDWAEYLRNDIGDLEQVLTTGRISAQSLTAFEGASKLGGVFRYNLFDKNGRIIFTLDRKLKGVAPASFEAPRLPLPISEALRDGPDQVTLKHGDVRSGWPAFYGEVYLPVKVDGRLLGVIEIYIDQEAKGAAYYRELLIFAIALTLLILLAASLPGLLIWRKTRTHRQLMAQLHHMAHNDPLTGLSNRTDFHKRLERALAGIGSKQQPVALLWIDLDRFKTVNDAFGHPIGDGLLCRVAKRFRKCLARGDLVARMGGDEFAVLLQDCPDRHHAAQLANRLIATLARPFKLAGRTIVVGASIGIVRAPIDGIQVDDLLKKADIALYRAKELGRSTYCFFESEMEASLQTHHALEDDLRAALAAGGLTLHYQPQVALDRNRIIGFEALLRWNHPKFGYMPPGDVIALAEETGLIVPLGFWALKEACAIATTWPGQTRVSVNISAKQFRNADMVGQVEKALLASGLQAGRLDLEITESVVMDDSRTTMSRLHQLRRLGVHISMDDFGTGYSSLSRLRRLPFDRVKIDRSFVCGLATSREDVAVVHAIITLGRSLGMEVIAEGVETEAQLAHLRREACDVAQGFFFGRPLPAEDIARQMNEPGTVIALGLRQAHDDAPAASPSQVARLPAHVA